MRNRFFITWIIGIFLVMSASLPTWAARISKVKGKSVIIELDGLELETGNKVFATDSGKRKAVIEITQVKGARALGKILKGKASENFDIEQPSKKGGSKQAGSSSSGSDKMYVGVLGGYHMYKQTANVATAAATKESVAMSGNGFSVKAFGDMEISSGLGVIGRLGAQMFNVKGNSVAATCTSCETKATYITGDGLLRYRFLHGDFQPYIAGGLGIYFPMSQSTNVLKTVPTTTVFTGELGMNIKVGDNAIVPISAEYGMFPPSADVKTTIISVRAGYGIRF